MATLVTQLVIAATNGKKLQHTKVSLSRNKTQKTKNNSEKHSKKHTKQSKIMKLLKSPINWPHRKRNMRTFERRIPTAPTTKNLQKCAQGNHCQKCSKLKSQKTKKFITRNEASIPNGCSLLRKLVLQPKITPWLGQLTTVSISPKTLVQPDLMLLERTTDKPKNKSKAH